MKVITLLLFVLTGFTVFAQSEDLCPYGVVYSYDAAGNRIARNPFGPCKTDGSDTVTTEPTEEQLAQLNQNRNLPLEEQEGFNIVLYPNPTNGILQVAAEQGFMGLSNKQAFIYSIKGELIFQQSIANRNFIIDLTDYAMGYYIVRVLADGYSKEWKVQKM